MVSSVLVYLLQNHSSTLDLDRWVSILALFNSDELLQGRIRGCVDLTRENLREKKWIKSSDQVVQRS